MKKYQKQSGFSLSRFLANIVRRGLKHPIRLTVKSGAGFTLIELIIYLAIVSIILVSISYLMIDILTGQTRNYTNQDINQQLRFMSGVIAKDIRSAQAVGSITSNNLVLVTPEDDITFNFDQTNKTLTRQIGLGSPITLHDFQVEATGSFTDLSYLERSKNIQVILNLNYSNPSHRAEYNASTTGIFSVELRGRK